VEEKKNLSKTDLECPCHCIEGPQAFRYSKTFVCNKTYPAANVRWSARDIATGLQHPHQFKNQKTAISMCKQKTSI